MAGKRQLKRNERLPPRVYLKRSRYVYTPPRENGKQVKDIRLCAQTATVAEVWTAYEALMQSLAAHNGKVDSPAASGTLAWLVQRYTASETFIKLAAQTQKKYHQSLDNWLKRKTNRGTLGVTALTDITPGYLTKAMDKRADTPVQANRDLAALSAAFSWGVARDYCPPNPCKSVSRFSEKPRDRYIEDHEYQAVYDLAATAPPYIRPAMELAYLTRMRRIEILGLKQSHVAEKGLLVKRRKGSKTQYVAWSERLERAVTEWFEHGAGKISDEGFATAWGRLWVKAEEQGIEPFTFHDLKAKGVSDFEGDKVKAAGHKTAAMADIYNRKIETVAPTN